MSLTAFSTFAEPQQPQLSGLAHERDLNFSEAVIAYESEVEQLEAAKGEYHLSLFPRLLGLARSFEKLGDFEAATAAARRAQHIGHRHDGVHTDMQLEIVDLMTRVHLSENKPMLADKQQKFAYYVKQSSVAEESMESLPARDKLSNWYERTGQLQRARRTTEKSLEIITKELGETSVEQLPYLKRLAKYKRLQRVCCSSRIMNQALQIVEANPDVDASVKAEIYLDIADTHTAASNTKQAAQFYEQAWLLMSEAERQAQFATIKTIPLSRPLNSRTASTVRLFRPERDAFGGSDFRKLNDDEVRELASLPPQEFVLNDEAGLGIRIRDRTVSQHQTQEQVVRTVGRPFSFLRSQFYEILPNKFRSQEAVDQITIELLFDIDASGRASNIQVLSSNVPSKVSSLMRDVIRKTRFRPRMQDGVLVATNQYRLTQSFAKQHVAPESI